MSSVKTELSRMFHGVTKVTDSPIFCGATENSSLFLFLFLNVSYRILHRHFCNYYLCKNCYKQEYSKEALFWCNLIQKL